MEIELQESVRMESGEQLEGYCSITVVATVHPPLTIAMLTTLSRRGVMLKALKEERLKVRLRSDHHRS